MTSIRWKELVLQQVYVLIRDLSASQGSTDTPLQGKGRCFCKRNHRHSKSKPMRLWATVKLYTVKSVCNSMMRRLDSKSQMTELRRTPRNHGIYTSLCTDFTLWLFSVACEGGFFLFWSLYFMGWTHPLNSHMTPPTYKIKGHKRPLGINVW